MSDTNISFAKIVANPKEYSWSQAYNAGKLFGVLSLETTDEIEEKDYLNIVGKEILDSLEQEFFTLETKDLDSIKKAVAETSKKIPTGIKCSFVIASFVNNVLYIYIIGNGKISLKREGKLGILLDANDQKSDTLTDASGFLQDNDVIILQTRQFSDIISTDTLSEFLDNLAPAEAAENLAPLVHEKDEAGAAAIIINYKSQVEEEEVLAPIVEPKVAEPVEEPVKKEEIVEERHEEPKAEESPFYSSKIERKFSFSDKLTPLFSKLRFPKGLDLNHPRKVILTIIVVIIIVFVGSIVFAVQKQQDTKTQTTFNSIYPQAQKKYDEGKGLLGLNQSLARDSFTQAKEILDNGKDKLPKDSKEEKQVLDLLAKVNSELDNTSGITASKASEVSLSESPILEAETKNPALYFAQDDKNMYGLTADAVFSLNLTGTSKKTIIENDSDWKKAAGIAPYNGNVYILDKDSDQILKYVAADSGYSKANYFSSTNPDFSKAVAMAIDSSVYVLSTDGTVAKFTKGNSDSFSLTGLDNSLSTPTRIFTNADTDNIYILDNGNSRVVVFDKTGSYKNQYQADIIKNAKDFDVDESGKKVFVLSGGKLYKIDLK